MRALENAEKGAGKHAFTVAIDSLLGSAIEGARGRALKDALNNLHKDAEATNMKFDCKENLVKIQNFQLMLIMFNPFSDTSH